MKVGDCLREFGTGGLRGISREKTFEDVIVSFRTPKFERDISTHPSVKPQEFLRKLVYASLPLGIGVVVDPFMGSGTTLAACLNVGYDSVGIERHPEYYKRSLIAIRELVTIST